MSVVKQAISFGGPPDSTVFVGNWVVDHDYNKNEQVALDGDLFLATTTHTSTTPTEPGNGVDWTDVWVRQSDMIPANEIAACASTDTPSGLNPYATKAYVDQLSFSVAGTAGEELSGYDVVYASSDGKYYLADANVTVVEADAVGIVVDAEGIAEDATGNIHIKPGFVTNSAWTWTPHESLYLGEDGNLTTNPSALNYTKPMGYAETATQIYFNPQTGWSNIPWFNIEADQLGIEYVPDAYTRTLTSEVTTTTQLTAHLKGINDELAAIRALLPS